MFQAELSNEGSYQVSIGAMRLRLSKLLELDNEARKIRTKGLKNDYEEAGGVVYDQRRSFIPEAI